MRKPEEHLARLSTRVVGITQATLQSHLALWGHKIDTLAALRLERPRILRSPGAGAPVDPETRALMLKRVRDLDLRIEGTLAECISEVEGELTARGITWRPAWYLGSSGYVDGEFWTANRANSINIPWYLANDQLWKAVNEVRVRYTRDDVMRVLRHEAGHAIGYAFELWRLVTWTNTFGDFNQRYRDEYRPDPTSTDYVKYLHNTGPSQNSHYAQKHPDEDWAETFAVWIDPNSDWRAAYPEGTGARTKLDYVDRIVNEQGLVYGRPPNDAIGHREHYSREAGAVGDFVGGWAQSDLWSPSSELMRREVGLEADVRAHDQYFEALGGAATRPTQRVTQAIGGYQRWEDEFRAVCASSADWAVTCWDTTEGRVRTLLLKDGRGLPAGCRALLVCDLNEHAYWGDFAGRKDLYVGAFLRNVDWEYVERNLIAASAPAPSPWGVLYAPPNTDNSRKNCGNCMLKANPEATSCKILDVPIAPTKVCGYHVNGAVPPDLAGLAEVGEGTSCDTCRFYQGVDAENGLCMVVANKTGEPPAPVRARACCARWD